MVLPIQLNKNLINLLTKYSDTVIETHFLQMSLNINQNNSIKAKIAMKNIIQRHIDFRNALVDPLNNVKVIEEHSKYFWDFTIKEKGQLRGPQAHLSHQMFSDFGFAKNGIEKLHLSGLILGSFYTPKNSIISYHKDITVESPHSFRQGIEVGGALIFSKAINGCEVYVTNDDPSIILPHDVLHRNMPSKQRIGDYSYIRKIKGSNNTDVVHLIQSDNKLQTSELAISKRYFDIPRAVFIGTVDIEDEQNKVKYIARQAMMGKIPVHHFDSRKNSQVNCILNKLEKDGKIEDANELIGFPFLLSNRHNENLKPINDSKEILNNFFRLIKNFEKTSGIKIYNFSTKKYHFYDINDLPEIESYLKVIYDDFWKKDIKFDSIWVNNIESEISNILKNNLDIDYFFFQHNISFEEKKNVILQIFLQCLKQFFIYKKNHDYGIECSWFYLEFGRLLSSYYILIPIKVDTSFIKEVVSIFDKNKNNKIVAFEKELHFNLVKLYNEKFHSNFDIKYGKIIEHFFTKLVFDKN